MTTIANIQSVQKEKHPMSSASLNQFHNEDLQEQCNTAAVAQELSDAELESVAGGIWWWIIPAIVPAITKAGIVAAATTAPKVARSSQATRVLAGEEFAGNVAGKRQK